MTDGARFRVRSPRERFEITVEVKDGEQKSKLLFVCEPLRYQKLIRFRRRADAVLHLPIGDGVSPEQIIKEMVDCIFGGEEGGEADYPQLIHSWNAIDQADAALDFNRQNFAELVECWPEAFYGFIEAYFRARSPEAALRNLGKR